MERNVISFVSLVIITLTLLLFSSCKTVEAWSYFVTTNTYIYIYIYFGIELAQIKLDELVGDVMNLDINKESMDDNRSYSHD